MLTTGGGSHTALTELVIVTKGSQASSQLLTAGW